METTKLVIRCESVTIERSDNIRRVKHGLCIMEVHNTIYSHIQETVIYIFHNEIVRGENKPDATYVKGIENTYVFDNAIPFETMQFKPL